MSKQKAPSILIAEDDFVSQKMIEFLFSQLKLAFYLAKNGQEALQMAQNNSFDIILMDMNMPVMSGLEAIRQIRILEKNNKQKLSCIYVLSAEEPEDVQEQIQGIDIQGIITKPPTEDKIQDILNNFIS